MSSTWGEPGVSFRSSGRPLGLLRGMAVVAAAPPVAGFVRIVSIAA